MESVSADPPPSSGNIAPPAPDTEASNTGAVDSKLANQSLLDKSMAATIAEANQALKLGRYILNNIGPLVPWDLGYGSPYASDAAFLSYLLSKLDDKKMSRSKGSKSESYIPGTSAFAVTSQKHHKTAPKIEPKVLAHAPAHAPFYPSAYASAYTSAYKQVYPSAYAPTYGIPSGDVSSNASSIPDSSILTTTSMGPPSARPRIATNAPTSGMLGSGFGPRSSSIPETSVLTTTSMGPPSARPRIATNAPIFGMPRSGFSPRGSSIPPTSAFATTAMDPYEATATIAPNALAYGVKSSDVNAQASKNGLWAFEQYPQQQPPKLSTKNPKKRMRFEEPGVNNNNVFQAHSEKNKTARKKARTAVHSNVQPSTEEMTFQDYHVEPPTWPPQTDWTEEFAQIDWNI